MIYVSKETKKLEQEVSNLTARLAREQEKSKRICREIKDTKERLKAKINTILSSGVYFESGYGSIYNQIL